MTERVLGKSRREDHAVSVGKAGDVRRPEIPAVDSFAGLVKIVKILYQHPALGTNEDDLALENQATSLSERIATSPENDQRDVRTLIHQIRKSGQRRDILADDVERRIEAARSKPPS